MESRAAALDPPAPGHGLVRSWAWLAALLLLAAPLSTPYQAALAARTPYAPGAGGLGRVLLALAVQAVLLGWPLAYLGLRFGRSIGWGAPLFAGARSWRAARAFLAGALLVGLIVGAVVSVVALVVPQLFPASFATARAEPPPPAAWKGMLSALGAGVTEEVTMRLFLMTALARVFARAARSPDGVPDGLAWSANALTALAFGALHFSNVAVLGLPFTFGNLSLVLLLNAGLGLACGELYRRWGIESAIVAHFAAAFVAHGVFPALAHVL